ncbi:MAG: hypothetical protein NTY55_02955 [Flavobacteriia bacterium]|nr:hypothetical protein [Flavobacteriia bacterium]
MNKIMEVALKGKFGENVDKVMEVVNATANPVMAVEILLGVWEETTLLTKVIDTRNRELTLVEVNHWNDTVKYSFVEEIVKSFYAHKDIDLTLVTSENYQDFKVSSNDDNAKWFNINTGEFTTRTDSCPIQYWLGYKESCSL